MKPPLAVCVLNVQVPYELVREPVAGGGATVGLVVTSIVTELEAEEPFAPVHVMV